jgi:ABC-type uncharacterized transport system permease subunit
MNFWVGVLHTAVIVATPLALAGLGELIAETSGVINLGVEGTMLMGAVAAFMTSIQSGDLWLGLLVGTLVGALMGALFAALTVSFRVNQIATGLTLVLLGTGLSGYIGRGYAGRPLQSAITALRLPLLHGVPWVGPVLFTQDVIVYGTVALCVAAWATLCFSSLGLDLRAVGEDPGTADAAGVPVYLLRYAAVVVGAALAGLGGAYFSVVFARAWASELTGGSGWVAVALVIAARWRPLPLLLYAGLFGIVDSLYYALQARGFTVSSSLLEMMPYLFTLIVFGLSAIRAGGSLGLGPRSLGRAYDREERV